jgi:hypothetical protein
VGPAASATRRRTTATRSVSYKLFSLPEKLFSLSL